MRDGVRGTGHALERGEQVLPQELCYEGGDPASSSAATHVKGLNVGHVGFTTNIPNAGPDCLGEQISIPHI